MDYVRRIKAISIRGRLAFATRCVELALKKENINNPDLNQVINKLWKFTSINDFRTWRKFAIELNPQFILEDSEIETNPDFITMSVENAHKLKEVYSTLPKYIVEILEDIICLGISDILTSIHGHSSRTLVYLMDVIDIMNNNQVQLPNLSDFEKSSFYEAGGWGNAVKKEFFYA